MVGFRQSRLRDRPAWLRRLHLATGLLSAVVLFRLIVRGFEFDIWTHLWTAYVCMYGAALARWSGASDTRAPEEQGGSWLF